MGGLAGRGGWPGVCCGGSSNKIEVEALLGDFNRRLAVGLYGPREDSPDGGNG